MSDKYEMVTVPLEPPDSIPEFSSAHANKRNPVLDEQDKPKGRPGVRIRKIKLDDKHKDDIAASQLLRILKKHAISSRGKLSASRIAAARVALPFLIPSLSAVDQTLHQPDDALTEDEIMAKFAALIEAHPDLLQRMLAMQAKAKEIPLQSVAAPNLGAA